MACIYNLIRILNSHGQPEVSSYAAVDERKLS